MRVYFVQGHLMGCNYVRALLPMWANNWFGNYVSLGSEVRSENEMVERIMASDVVVFHRPETHFHHKIAMECKKLGKKVVFDNDDTFKLDHYHPFFSVDSEKFTQNLEYKNNLLNNFMKNADMCTASTEFLAEEYKQWNDNVVVLPNTVDPRDWAKNPLRNKGKKKRIGIVGSVGYAHDFEIIEGFIKELDDSGEVELVLFGMNDFSKAAKDEDSKTIQKLLIKEAKFWQSLKHVEHVPWVKMSDYFTTLNSLRLDLMLIPRRNNSFNKAKSNIKFLEAGMLEIPVIASSFPDKDSPYDKDLNGDNGILVSTIEDWRGAVDYMISNDERRLEIGRNARKYVIDNYHIDKHAHKWVEAYESLINKK